MTNTLRVLIPETWPEEASAAWVLLDANGQVANSGHSEPRGWPAATRTEAIILGAQTSWHRVKVPRASAREQAQALGFALEEHLVREADSQHATPTLREEEAWTVLVIARERLRRLGAQFDSIGRSLDAAYSAYQCVPYEAGKWTLAIHEQVVTVRGGAHAGFSDDLNLDHTCPELLAISLEALRGNADFPAALTVLGDYTQLPLDDWSAKLALPLAPAGSWKWFSPNPDASNLLSGEFAPRHRNRAWQRAARPAAYTLVAALVVHLALSIGYAWWRQAEYNDIKRSMTQLLRTQLPNDPVSDPAAQLKRELNTQRAVRGLLADDAALALMADLATALGSEGTGALQTLHYQEGMLEIVLAPGKADLASLQSRLVTQGITATPRENNRIALRRAN